MTRTTEPTDDKNHQNHHKTDEDDPHEGANQVVAPARVGVPSVRGSRSEDHREQDNRAYNASHHGRLSLGLTAGKWGGITPLWRIIALGGI
jgi:hypothetical protein